MVKMTKEKKIIRKTEQSDMSLLLIFFTSPNYDFDS